MGGKLEDQVTDQAGLKGWVIAGTYSSNSLVLQKHGGVPGFRLLMLTGSDRSTCRIRSSRKRRLFIGVSLIA